MLRPTTMGAASHGSIEADGNRSDARGVEHLRGEFLEIGSTFGQQIDVKGSGGEVSGPVEGVAHPLEADRMITVADGKGFDQGGMFSRQGIQSIDFHAVAIAAVQLGISPEFGKYLWNALSQSRRV